jgi:hypothetical protein
MLVGHRLYFNFSTLLEEMGLRTILSAGIYNVVSWTIRHYIPENSIFLRKMEGDVMSYKWDYNVILDSTYS